tara:strand:+ start:212 stop:502 length:291 start_codon:yes stop_codon:yes gene_type:complete
MATYKIVGFAFANSDNSVYINSQLNAIKNAISSVEIELADETDSRLHRHIQQKPGGYNLPIIMILKDSTYIRHRNGKINNKEIIDWVQASIPGLNA